MKKKPKILFFPWGAGGGAAYTGHCLVLADHLKKHNYELAFADGGLSFLIEKAGYRVLKQSLPLSTTPEEMPAFLPFANLERVYSVAARFYRKSRLHQQYEEDLRLIQEFRPDLVVIDMVATAAIAARSLGIPVLSIAEYDFLSREQNSWMPWFEGNPQDLLPYPSCVKAFQELCNEVGLPSTEHVCDLLWGDLTLVPSIEKLDPVSRLPNCSGKVHYAGPLFWDPPWVKAEDICLPKKKDSTQVNLYISLGSGGMGGIKTIQNLITACHHRSLNGFVSLGFTSEEAIHLPKNIRSGGFTGINAPLQWADLVLTHGGSSSVLASLYHGKPMVVYPFMSECEMNGRVYVEKTGAGLLAQKSRALPGQKHLQFYSDQIEASLPHDQTEEQKQFFSALALKKTLEKALQSQSYSLAAKSISKNLKKARQDTDIPSLFESLL